MVGCVILLYKVSRNSKNNGLDEIIFRTINDNGGGEWQRNDVASGQEL